MKQYIISAFMVSIFAYAGASIALMQFNQGYAIMVIPSKDGNFIAKDINKERALKAHDKRRVSQGAKN